MQASIDSNLKATVRETFLDLLENERERFYPIFVDIIEDMGLARAMEEGEKSPRVDEKNILRLLK